MKTSIFFFLVLVMAGSYTSHGLELNKVRLLPGFTIGIYATAVPGARSLALGSDGTVYVGSRDEGKVYALPNRNKGKTADPVITIASGLCSIIKFPHDRNQQHLPGGRG